MSPHPVICTSVPELAVVWLRSPPTRARHLREASSHVRSPPTRAPESHPRHRDHILEGREYHQLILARKPSPESHEQEKRLLSPEVSGLFLQQQ